MESVNNPETIQSQIREIEDVLRTKGAHMDPVVKQELQHKLRYLKIRLKDFEVDEELTWKFFKRLAKALNQEQEAYVS